MENNKMIDNNYSEGELLKRQLKIFFLIAFGLSFLMGIGIYYGKSKDIDISMFPMFQMFTPALGAIVAMYITRKDDERMPKLFFKTYIVSCILMGIAAISSLFISGFPVLLVTNLGIVIASIVLLVVLLVEKRAKKQFFNLSPGKVGKVFLVLLLFLILYFIRVGIGFVFSEGLDEFLKHFTLEKFKYLLALLPIFFISFMPFFGEEYGWRYFLQPILQKKFGMVKGILLLGFLWGIWHLPLNLFFYSAEGTGLLSLLNQISVCVTYSIFFAVAYGYSDSIWAPTIIHYFNNNLVLFFTENMDPSVIENQEYTWEAIGINLATGLILFGIFIFSKYNRKEEYRMPTPNERLREEIYEGQF